MRAKIDAQIEKDADVIASMPGADTPAKTIEYLTRLLANVQDSVGPSYNGNLSNAAGRVRKGYGAAE